MRSKRLLILIIVLVGCLSQFSSDIYAPALPNIAHKLLTQISLVQISMAVYMLGIAVSILIYGFISEALGRRTPLIIGLCIATIGSIVCMFANNIYILILGRLIQGLGFGATAGLWRAIFRDLFSGKELAKYGSYLTIFVTFIIPAAPVLGGYLQNYLSWRAIFAFIGVYALFTLSLIIFAFKETSVHHHPEHLRIAYIRSSFHNLLTNPIFSGTTICTLLTYGAFFSWFVVGPVLLINVVGITPIEFGWLSAIAAGVACIIGSISNAKLVSRFGIPNMLRFGWGLMLLSGISLFICKFIFGVNLWSIFLPATAFYFGSIFIWPNIFATAMTPFAKNAGYAGSAYGFMQMIGGGVIGLIAAHLPTETQVPLAIMFIVLVAVAWLVFEKVVKPHMSL